MGMPRSSHQYSYFPVCLRSKQYSIYDLDSILTSFQVCLSEISTLTARVKIQKKKVYMYTCVISYAAQVPIMVYFEAHHVVSYHAEKSAFCPLFPCRYSMDLIDYQKSIIVIFLQSRIASCSWPHGIPASCLWLLRYVVV